MTGIMSVGYTFTNSSATSSVLTIEWTRLRIAIDGRYNDFAQRVDFDLIGTLLKPRSKFLDTRVLCAALEYDSMAGRVRRGHGRCGQKLTRRNVSVGISHHATCPASSMHHLLIMATLNGSKLLKNEIWLLR
jgi:hypothetical protein